VVNKDYQIILERTFRQKWNNLHLSETEIFMKNDVKKCNYFYSLTEIIYQPLFYLIAVFYNVLLDLRFSLPVLYSDFEQLKFFT